MTPLQQTLFAGLPWALKAKMLDYKIDYVGNEHDTITGLYKLGSNHMLHCETIGGSRPSHDRIKPILHDLSFLNKEIEIGGERFVPIKELDSYHDFSSMNWEWIKENPTRYPHTVVQQLNAWHFNCYGLKEGEYIPVHTLQTNPY